MGRTTADKSLLHQIYMRILGVNELSSGISGFSDVTVLAASLYGPAKFGASAAPGVSDVTPLLSSSFPAPSSLLDSFLDFDNLPETGFSCEAKVMDIKFLCLNGTVFDQETRVCERVDEVDCSKTEGFYDLNLELYGAQGYSIHTEDVSEEQSTTTTSTSTTTSTTTTTTTPRPPPPPQPTSGSLQFPSSSPGAVALLSLHNTFTGLQPAQQQHPHGVAHTYFSNSPRPHAFHQQFFFGRSVDQPTQQQQQQTLHQQQRQEVLRQQQEVLQQQQQQQQSIHEQQQALHQPTHPPTIIATSRSVTRSVSIPGISPSRAPLQQPQQPKSLPAPPARSNRAQPQEDEYDADYVLESFYKDVPRLQVARSSRISVSTSSSSSSPVIVAAPPELSRQKRQTRGGRQRSRSRTTTSTTEAPTEAPSTSPAPMIPVTSFTCSDKIPGGFYADVEADCTFRYSRIESRTKARYGVINDHRFLCGPDTRFDQNSRTCVAREMVRCSLSESLYHLNNHFLHPQPDSVPPEERDGAGFEPKRIAHGRRKRATAGRRGPPDYTLPTLPSESRKFECPDEDGLYADFASDCQAYHQCTSNQHTLHICPYPRIFNEALGVCDSWDEENCELYSEALYSSHKTGNKKRSKRNAPRYTLDKLPEKSRTFQCPLEDGLYADIHSDCQAYHQCDEHKHTISICPHPSVFNEALGVCDSWENVNCELFSQAHFSSQKNGKRRSKRNAPRYTLHTLPEQSRKFQCPLEDGLYADIHSDCQAYHQCDERKHSISICPHPSVFNEALGVCDSWENVNCELFSQANYHSQKTRRNKRNAPQYSLTSLPTTTKQFKCPKEDGYYADRATNCQVYHQCDKTQHSLHICQYPTVYNEALGVCDAWENVDCELYSQAIHHSHKTRTKRSAACDTGDLPAGTPIPDMRSNCSRYYICVHREGEAELTKLMMKCGPGKVMDAKLRKCVPGDQCLSRLEKPRKRKKAGSKKNKKVNVKKFETDSSSTIAPPVISTTTASNTYRLGKSKDAVSKNSNFGSKNSGFGTKSLFTSKNRRWLISGPGAPSQKSISLNTRMGRIKRNTMLGLKKISAFTLKNDKTVKLTGVVVAKTKSTKKLRTKRSSNPRYSRIRKPNLKAAILDADSASLEELLELRAALRRSPGRRRKYESEYEEEEEEEEDDYDEPPRRSNKRRPSYNRYSKHRPPVYEDEYVDESVEPGNEEYDETEPENIPIEVSTEKIDLKTLLEVVQKPPDKVSEEILQNPVINKLLVDLLTSTVSPVIHVEIVEVTTETPQESSTTLPAPPEATTPSSISTTTTPSTTTPSTTTPSTTTPTTTTPVPTTTTPVPTTTTSKPTTLRPYVIRRVPTPVPTTTLTPPIIRKMPLIREPTERKGRYSPNRRRGSALRTSSTSTEEPEVSSEKPKRLRSTTKSPYQTQSPVITTTKSEITVPETTTQETIITTTIKVPITSSLAPILHGAEPEITVTTPPVTTTEIPITESVTQSSTTTVIPSIIPETTSEITTTSTKPTATSTESTTTSTFAPFKINVPSVPSPDFVEDQVYDDSNEYYSEYDDPKDISSEIIPNTKGSQELQESQNNNHVKKFDSSEFPTHGKVAHIKEVEVPLDAKPRNGEVTAESITVTEKLLQTPTKPQTLVQDLTPPAPNAEFSVDFPENYEYVYDEEEYVAPVEEPKLSNPITEETAHSEIIDKSTEKLLSEVTISEATTKPTEIFSENPIHLNALTDHEILITHSPPTSLTEETLAIRIPHKLTEAITEATDLPDNEFTCTDRDMFTFHADPNDCHVFHYCSPGFHKHQILDFRFQCLQDTAFEPKTQKCEKKSSICH
ncbi:hypothetical protein B566_EDAN013892 [Ephemera danica]|nr:hypothetical protein B566_EDAN013892 [Ephemera danica]